MPVFEKITRLYRDPLGHKQWTDSGMALVLLLLLIGALTGNNLFFILAIPFLVINMIFPKIFLPWAWFWFGTTRLIGHVVSPVILAVIYVLFLLPAGLIRRWSGKDPLLLKQFRKDKGSVFVTRNITFTRSEVEKPF